VLNLRALVGVEHTTRAGERDLRKAKHKAGTFTLESSAFVSRTREEQRHVTGIFYT
jgi:hypothetical protein